MKNMILAVLLLVALLLFPAVCGAGQQVTVGLQAGQQAPDFSLQLHSGEDVTLSELQGKPVVLNFYTTWCPPCQLEMPDFQKIYEEYGDLLHMLGVSAGEEIAVVDAFLAETGYTYPMAYDPAGTVSSAYSIDFIPQTWILDSDGIIVEYIAGMTTESALKEILDSLL